MWPSGLSLNSENMEWAHRPLLPQRISLGGASLYDPVSISLELLNPRLFIQKTKCMKNKRINTSENEFVFSVWIESQYASICQRHTFLAFILCDLWVMISFWGKLIKIQNIQLAFYFNMQMCNGRIIILIVLNTKNQYSPEYHPVEFREPLPLSGETELFELLRKFGLRKQSPSKQICPSSQRIGLNLVHRPKGCKLLHVIFWEMLQ